MYHRFNHVDLRGTYNGFLIPNSPRAAPQACGLSPGFNGSRWIILGSFSWDMNYTSISPLWGYFAQFVCRSLPLAHPACHSMRVCCVSNAGRCRASAGPLCEEPQRVWSLTPPSHFRQIKVWKVSPEAISVWSGWVKNVYEGCVAHYL